jgi:hypothetical protein
MRCYVGEGDEFAQFYEPEGLAGAAAARDVRILTISETKLRTHIIYVSDLEGNVWHKWNKVSIGLP